MFILTLLLLQGELEDRYNNQMRLLQAREKALQEQLQQTLRGSQVSSRGEIHPR